MAERILLQRRMDLLVPGDSNAMDVVRAMKPGQGVYCEIKLARNPRQHRLYWALCGIVFENSGLFVSVDDVSDYLKMHTGHGRWVEYPDGSRMFKPKSISYANMGQAKFNAFFDQVVNLVCEKIIPNMDQGDLRRELSQMVGIYDYE